MLGFLHRLQKHFRAAFSDESFLHSLERIESFVSKVLSIAMVLVIAVSVYNLGIVLFMQLFSAPAENFGTVLFSIFGMFLNVLIALEILENITAYLKKHVIQVELVIVTSLIAVARKIIILDLEKKDAMDLIALAFAIAALSGSYWIIRRMNSKSHPL